MKDSYLKRMMKDVLVFWPWYFASIISTIGYLLLDIYMRSMTGTVTDAAINKHDNFFALLAIMLISFLAAAPLHASATFTKATLSQKMMYKLRISIGKKAVCLSLPYLETHQSGDIISHLGDELARLDMFVYYGLSMITTLFTQAICVTIVMSLIDIKLTLIFIVSSLLLLPLGMRLSHPIEKNEMKIRKALGHAQQAAQEGLSALITVKSFRLENIMDKRYWIAVKEALTADLHNQQISTWMTAGGSGLGLLPQIAMLVLGAFSVAQGSLTPGQLLSLTMVSNGFCNWLQQAPDIFIYLRQASAACERIYGFLDMPEETGGDKMAPMPNSTVACISNVNFSYPGKPPVLYNFSLKLKEGETVALVGPSGCGKSTVLKLLCGFIHPDSGTVQVLGNHIEDWNLQALRANLAVVAQESYLFPGSLRENLCAARASISDEVLEAICKSANIWELVKRRGFDADVGERGLQLSIGERQRVAIARAFLKDAPLLLLDEPTSALDASAEVVVQQSLDKLMQGRTTLLIAHRLSTVRNADRILVMQGGKVVQEGTHEELLKVPGLYNTMYRQQTSNMEGMVS